MGRHFPALAVCLILFCPVVNSQTNKTFPTDDEITLVVTQTERALSDYEASVSLEAKLADKEDDIANDKRVIQGKELSAEKERRLGFLPHSDRYRVCKCGHVGQTVEKTSRKLT